MGVKDERAGRSRNALRDLLGESWVTELYSEVAARRAGSAALVERLRNVDAGAHAFWPMLAPPMPLAIRRATGSRLTDVDGNGYLDCHLGFGAQALHGHNPPAVVRFVKERLDESTGNHYLHPIELDLAELLREVLPHCEKFAFLHSGTEATHAAIRLARTATGKRLVAKFEGALHGSHDLAVHNTAFWYHGNPARPFPAAGPDGIAPEPALAGVSTARAQDLLVLPNDLPAAIELIERHAGELACVLGEAASSALPFPDLTVPLMRGTSEACERLGVPFVLDEVLTGFRWGIGGAADIHGIKADLYTYGKVISGLGVPLSAVGGKAEFLDHTQSAGDGWSDIGRKTAVQGTHTGNFISLCASYASLSLLKELGPSYYEETRAKVAVMQDRLTVFREEHGIPIRLLGFGDFIGTFQFVPRDSFTDYREYVSATHPALFLLTLLLRKRGIFTLNYPMIFTGGAHQKSDIDEIIGAVTDSCLELESNGFPFGLTAGSLSAS